MSGIGNTIETDLVGEFVEVIDPGEYGNLYRERHVRTVARGRVRAVHTNRDHQLCLWLEVVYAWDASSWTWTTATLPEIGDVLVVCVDGGNGTRTLRLIKHPDKNPH